LNEKERYIIERRITADEPMTLQEIACHFSRSRERVRQIDQHEL
jgi:RNA polymerase sigma-32 factor